MTATTSPRTVDLAPGVWKIDPGHAEVGFVGRHFGLTKVRGRFTGIDGTIVVAGEITESTIDVTIDMSTVDSGDSTRDDHLRSGDFFDIANHTSGRFRSTQITVEGGQGTIDGDLTLKGITRAVSLNAEFLGAVLDPWGAEQRDLQCHHHHRPRGLGTHVEHDPRRRRPAGVQEHRVGDRGRTRSPGLVRLDLTTESCNPARRRSHPRQEAALPSSASVFQETPRLTRATVGVGDCVAVVASVNSTWNTVRLLTCMVASNSRAWASAQSSTGASDGDIRERLRHARPRRDLRLPLVRRATLRHGRGRAQLRRHRQSH